MRALLVILALVLPAGAAYAGVNDDDPVIVRALRDEMARTMADLKLDGVAGPYYVAYTIVDFEAHVQEAVFGAVTLDDHMRWRQLSVDLRVGDYGFDNSNFVDDGFGGITLRAVLPVDDDYAAVRREAWLLTDTAYKRAVETIEKKRAVNKRSTRSSKNVPDFTPAAPVRHLPAVAALERIDRAHDLVRHVSAQFLDPPGLHHGSAELLHARTVRYFVSSEGSVIIEPKSMARVDLVARVQAADGMPVKNYATFVAASADGLPAAGELAETARGLASRLRAVAAAPPAQTRSAPVLFEGVAAPQLLRHLLAEHLSGTPAPQMADQSFGFAKAPRPFDGKLNRQVMTPGFTVIDDPTLDRWPGVGHVTGGYAIDDEGVRAQRVSLIENGVLKTLLMSRAPSEHLAASNGHARAGLFGMTARAYPANLLVQPGATVGSDALRRLLMKEIEASGADYGFVVRLIDDPQITGMEGHGFGRGGLPPALVAVRVDRDGSETLVRGLNFGTLDQRALRRIVAAGGEPAAYHYLGNQSFGGAMIPVSIVAPALLLGEVELREADGEFPRPPLVSHPVGDR